MAAQKLLVVLFLVLLTFMEQTRPALAAGCRESIYSVIICEHDKAILGCVNGGNIHVVEASYGRHNRHTCRDSNMRNTNCHAGNSHSIIGGRCQGRNSCEIYAKNSVFGDPCRGTYKYLEVKYFCG